MVNTRTRDHKNIMMTTFKHNTELTCNTLDLPNNNSTFGNVSVKRLKAHNDSNIDEPGNNGAFLDKKMEQKGPSPTSSTPENSNFNLCPSKYIYTVGDSPEKALTEEIKYNKCADKNIPEDISESQTDADASFEQSPEKMGAKMLNVGNLSLTDNHENQQRTYEDMSIPPDLQLKKYQADSPEHIYAQLDEEHRHVLEETQRKVSEVASNAYAHILRNLAEAKRLYQTEEVRNIHLQKELGDVTEALKQVEVEVAKVLHGSL